MTMNEALEWQTARELAFLDASDRVRARSSSHLNERLDEQALERVRQLAGHEEEEITERIAGLEKEWDLERALVAGASSLALLGMVSAGRDRRLLVVPVAVLALLLDHAVRGWSPVLPLLRRFGLRTRREIDVEKYALKHLRGDFAGADPSAEQ